MKSIVMIVLLQMPLMALDENSINNDVGKVIKLMHELPPCRNQEELSKDGWIAYGKCAKVFQNAPADVQIKIVKEFNKNLASQKIDEQGPYSFWQMVIMLRLVYVIEGDNDKVTKLSVSAKNSVWPLIIKDDVITLARERVMPNGLVTLENQYRGISRNCAPRDLKKFKFRVNGADYSFED